MAPADGKKKALDIALASILKAHGDGAVMRLGQATHMNVEVIPTGSLALDIALGVGGIPRGRISEIYGPESSGKTTICQHIVAQAQRKGGTAAYIDMEHALDPSYAAKCGVDVDNLLISQPDTGEQAFDIAEQLIRSNAVDIVVIDSVAALVPKGEIEGEITDMQPGMQARLMSKALRRLAGVIKQTNTSVMFTNQLRQKIGIMFGNPETTTGGMALKFYASVRLDVRREQTIKVGGEVVGSRTRVRVTKNKVAAPFREASFDIMYNEGISQLGDMLDVATNLNVVEKRGTFLLFEGTRLGQGRDNAKAYLREHPEAADKIEKLVRGTIASGTATKAAPVTKPEEGEDDGEAPDEE
ncbi:MAG TPA: recombinase RecA [Thermoflexales bacterium]|nr:recombinase RecA [Thermoflexales bacterium]HQZ99050.1 recombinase RecA [Thermoflexales bacterium]